MKIHGVAICVAAAAAAVCVAGSTKPQIPKKIWTYWGKGEIPEFVSLCIAGWRQLNPEYSIVCLRPWTVS